MPEQPARVTYAFRAGGIFDAALDAVVVMDAAGIVRDWNPAAEQIFGYGYAEAVGGELAELIIPGPLRDAHRNALRRYLETGQSTILDRRIELAAIRRGGEEFPIELTITRVPDSGEVVFAGFIRDLGELDDARRENTRLQKRMAFLAEAGLVLEESLDVDETLHRLADLTVPELAELTVVDLLGAGRTIRMAVAAAVDPDVAPQVEELRRIEPVRLDSDHPVARVLNSGKPVLIESMTPSFHAEIAQGPAHRETIRRLGYRSAVVVPLMARHRVLGGLSLLRMHSPEPYGHDDVVLAVELARRAALAVDNARLFGGMRHLAQTLQHSLLPHTIPEIPGVHVTARYRAAAEEQDVGGDFYDVFAIGEDQWGIAIGDVCGKGPEAAARTSMARHTIRALSDREPATVLRSLNDALTQRADMLPERFLTVLLAVARWEPGGLALELVSAGHPRPIVRRSSGAVETVPTAGLLLGMTANVAYSSKRVLLQAGDAVIFYTDGLTDARAPHEILSERDLMAAVSHGHGLPGDDLADFLEQTATAGARPRDDIALVILELVNGRGVDRAR